MPACDHFRVHARRRVDFWVIVRREGLGWQRDARIVDLGFGGACVEIGELLEPGTEVAVEIRAPTLWDPLKLPGSVVWARRDGAAMRLGIRFDHREPSPLFALFELLGAQAYDISDGTRA